MAISNDILDLPLIGLSQTDCIPVRDSVEGIFVAGAPGSGKSANVGRQFGAAFLRIPNSGALILTAKTEETTNWLQYARDCGREDDVIVSTKRAASSSTPSHTNGTAQAAARGTSRTSSIFSRPLWRSAKRKPPDKATIRFGNAATNP